MWVRSTHYFPQEKLKTLDCSFRWNDGEGSVWNDGDVRVWNDC
jgi:hypothetical protein